ncbi:PREDICTED: NACHT, LRR and PYD domains-containing protein 9-like [Elephantulus edwardii]|uniref:NACHT, LRR and PYD domains-containing protein 9-like n=1 Tax=Elephantulus edwardii TaxID=28737 RepID=UPI0003F05FB1|nr:PREDICTED: NACHT, LRR and PYD domains-containing protein 9-like [Elephantulus edwardii]
MQHDILSNAFTSEETNQGSNTVVLRGFDGMGKTTLLRKAILEWAEGNLWKDRFKFVIFLDACDMSRVTETSLAEAISRDWPACSKPVGDVLSQPQDILLVIDGFEKLKCHWTIDTNTNNDWRRQQPTEVILNSLLQKKMLPEASLLVALGTKVMQNRPFILWHPKYIDMQGFSEIRKKAYFFQFFQEKWLASKAFRYVRDKPFLLSVCQNPLVCYLICSCLKWQLDRGECLDIVCGNITYLYASYLISVMKAGGQRLSHRQNKARLQGLCSLAAEGIWTQKYKFCRGDLKRNGLSDLDTSMWQGVDLLRRNGDCFVFPHKQVQEFCTSLFYLLEQPQDRVNPAIGSISQLLGEAYISDTRQLITNSYCIKHCRNLQKLSICIENDFPDDSRIFSRLYFLSNFGDRVDFFRAICDKPHLENLNLRGTSLSLVAVRELCETLKHPTCNIKQLNLDMCKLSPTCCDALASALVSCRTLKSLSLDGITLDYLGVLVLCVALGHPDCALHTLGMVALSKA